MFNIPVRIKTAFRLVLGRVVSARYFVLALLVPLGIRSVPEMIAGQYPIGYDTITTYVPSMIDWGEGRFSGLSLASGGWLVYSVFGIAYLLSRLNPVVIAKIAAPIFYAFLGATLYIYARGSLRWNHKYRFLLVLFASTYFVIMRMSWDLLRNTFGLALLLLTLSLAQGPITRRKGFILALLGWLVASTQLLAGGVLLGLMLIDLLATRSYRLVRTLVILPALGQFSVSLVFLRFQGSFLTSPSYNSQWFWPLLFPVYIFLPLLPFAIIGARIREANQMRRWLSLCSLGLFVAVTPIALSPSLVTPDRWSLMMAVPMLVFAVQGLKSNWLQKAIVWRHVFSASWLLILVSLTFGYVFLPASHALPYYGYFAPTSMLQSTVPAEFSPQVVDSISWVSHHASSDSVIMIHNAFYGWMRVYYTGSVPFQTYEPGVNLTTALHAIDTRRYSAVYTIWWTNHDGWYGDPSVPSGFHLQYSAGQIGVFSFVISSIQQGNMKPNALMGGD